MGFWTTCSNFKVLPLCKEINCSTASSTVIAFVANYSKNFYLLGKLNKSSFAKVGSTKKYNSGKQKCHSKKMVTKRTYVATKIVLL